MVDDYDIQPFIDAMMGPKIPGKDPELAAELNDIMGDLEDITNRVQAIADRYRDRYPELETPFLKAIKGRDQLNTRTIHFGPEPQSDEEED